VALFSSLISCKAYTESLQAQLFMYSKISLGSTSLTEFPISVI